jgi:hypothetical protein
LECSIRISGIFHAKKIEPASLKHMSAHPLEQWMGMPEQLTWKISAIKQIKLASQPPRNTSSLLELSLGS